MGHKKESSVMGARACVTPGGSITLVSGNCLGNLTSPHSPPRPSLSGWPAFFSLVREISLVPLAPVNLAQFCFFGADSNKTGYMRCLALIITSLLPGWGSGSDCPAH